MNQCFEIFSFTNLFAQPLNTNKLKKDAKTQSNQQKNHNTKILYMENLVKGRTMGGMRPKK